MSKAPKTRLKLNSPLLPGLVGLLLVLHLTIPFRGWLILLVGLGGGWLVSYVWARALARNVRLIRQTRFGWAQVGDRLEERFTLINRGDAPALWVEIIDHSNLPAYRASRVTGVGGRSENHWQTQGLCQQRGLFTLGPTSLYTGDPFGLYTISQHYPESITLTVTPPILPLPVIQVAPGGRAGEGRPRPNAPERTVTVATVREYTPGDNYRWIHWPTSARKNSLFVRLFDNTPAGDWWIFVDMQQPVQAGQGQRATEEHAVILSASLADRGLRQGHSVGLVMYGQRLTWLPPHTGESHRWAMLQALAQVNPGSLSLAELLARVRPGFGRLASLILITPDVSGAWVEALLPLLRRGAVATVLLLDPLSFGGSGNPAGVLSLLANQGIVHYIITPDLLDRPEARPGRRGQWEWRISPSGRAIPVRPLPDTAWRTLS